MAKINFSFGKTVSFETLPNNSIALDGYVQGAHLDPINRRFSFDHHADCVRLVTLATCQQVWTALQLGLDGLMDVDTEICVNDIDADTSLSVWLLLNPTRVREPRVKELVDRVGLTDSHGPTFESHPLHREIGYFPGQPQQVEKLEEFLAKISSYVDGTWKEPPARPERPSKGFAWAPKTGWVSVETTSGFDGLYKQGFLAGFLVNESPNGTLTYTVAKRSDLVPLPLGPSHVDRQKDPSSYRHDTILGKLGMLEREINPAQALETSWGGGTSIGGSPRNADKSASQITIEQALDVCKSMTPSF